MQEITVKFMGGTFKIEVYGGGAGALDSDMDLGPGLELAQEAIESLVLGHACAGIDVNSDAYVEGLDAMIEALGDHIEDNEP